MSLYPQCVDPRLSQPRPNPRVRRFYGKYSGEVLDNVDTGGLYRLKVRVPVIPATLGGVWARPCVPYFGDSVGFFTIPPIGARVWVEFETGNPDLPLWTGGFWPEGELKAPIEDSPLDYPNSKILKTENCQLLLDDREVDGQVFLEIRDPAVEVPVTMKFYKQGVEIQTGISTLTMNPEDGIALKVGDDTMMRLEPEGISMTAPKISAQASGEISLDAGGALSVSAGEDASLEAGGGLQQKAEGEIGLTAGGEGGFEAAGALSVRAGDLVSLDAGADLQMAAAGAAELSADGLISQEAGADFNVNATTSMIDTAMEINGVVNAIGGFLEDGTPLI